jgi:hypothetical protein
MNIRKIHIAAVIIAIIVTATATTTAFLSVTVLATPLLGQGDNTTTGAATTTASPTGQQSTTIHITKDSTNSYVISGGSSSVASFDTTYRIAGERSAIRASENLVISTVTDDFKKSPTIGYIRAGNMTATAAANTTTTLPNPFATPEVITERITNELRRVISEADNNTSQGQYVEINCGFGMTLEDMRCHYVPLLGAGQ